MGVIRARPSIWWLIPCMGVFAMSYGGTLVPKTNLVLSIVCQQYLDESRTMGGGGIPSVEDPRCRVPEVQSRTATFALWLTLIPGALGAVVAPKYGAASDRHGRVRMLSLVAFITLLSETAFFLVAWNPLRFQLKTVLLSAVFDGLSGSITAIMALTTSYAADCTSTERRNVAFGFFHGVLFGGLSLGPMIAGVIMKLTGDALRVFYAGMGGTVTFFVCVAFLVPESLSADRRRKHKLQHAHAHDQEHEHEHEHEQQIDGPPRVSAVSTATATARSWFRELSPRKLFQPLTVFFPDLSSIADAKERKVMTAVRRNLQILALLDTVVFGVKMGSAVIIIMYAEYLFGWGNVESSFFVSLVSTVRMAVLLGILPALTRLIRGPQRAQHVNTGCDRLDLGIIWSSMLLDIAGYLGYACSPSSLPFILSGAFEAIGAMISPTLQSSLTKHVPPEQTGQVLGAVGLLHSLSKVIVPAGFSLLYRQTVRVFPQAFFVVLMASGVVALVISMFIKTHVYMPDGDSEVDDETRVRRSSLTSEHTPLLAP